MKFETRAIRTQTDRSQHREHSTPIFATSSFIFEDAEKMRAIFAGEEQGNVYSRFTNPSVEEFQDKIAVLEGTEACRATASGMSAVFATFASLLAAGDHMVMSRAVFGSTFNIKDNFLAKWNISCTLVDANDVDNWEKAIQPNTKLIYLETPSNPGLEIIDLAKVAALAKAHDIISIVDNCFATPYLQRPTEHDIDMVIHSATKYIDGQGRVLGGAVAGPQHLIDKVHQFLRGAGPSLSPFNAWVLSKSLETLAVRMDRHCDNATQLAAYLYDHKAVAHVNYPFLGTNPMLDIAKKQMSQGGGMVTINLAGGLQAGRSLIDNLKMASRSANLGDTRTIITHPASTTHGKVRTEERLLMGITDGMVRISCGLEHIDDIIEDVDQALSI